MFYSLIHLSTYLAFLGDRVVKNLPANTGDMGLIAGSRRNGNPLQYSHLENPRDRGAWWATIHGVAKELDMS